MKKFLDHILLLFGFEKKFFDKENLKNTVIQGGLNPKVLLSSEQEIMKSAKRYFDAFKGLPYVFNLGHGMLPETNPENVDKLINFYIIMIY